MRETREPTLAVKTARIGSGYVFHIYVPAQGRIACGLPADVRAAVREDWALRMDQDKMCAVCLRAVQRDNGNTGVISGV